MRNFTVIAVEQRSADWKNVRLGRLTGSAAGAMLSKIKSGESASRRNLRVRLVLERVTCKSQERVVQTQAMQDGIDREPEALRAYEALTGHSVRLSGFLRHDALLAGASLDGHVGDFEGIVEAKCPLATTHLDYLRTGTVPEDYRWQCIHALWLTGAKWCDWLSFHPEFPGTLCVKLVRIERNEQEIADYDAKVRAFLADVETEYQAVLTMHDLGSVLKAVVNG